MMSETSIEVGSERDQEFEALEARSPWFARLMRAGRWLAEVAPEELEALVAEAEAAVAARRRNPRALLE